MKWGLYTVLCTATVYTVLYYKPILQLIFLLLPNGFPTLSFRAYRSASVENIKSRRSIAQCPMLGECWVQIFAKFAFTDFAQKRPNSFRKKPDCSRTANLGG